MSLFINIIDLITYRRRPLKGRFNTIYDVNDNLGMEFNVANHNYSGSLHKHNILQYINTIE